MLSNTVYASSYKSNRATKILARNRKQYPIFANRKIWNVYFLWRKKSRGCFYSANRYFLYRRRRTWGRTYFFGTASRTLHHRQILFSNDQILVGFLVSDKTDGRTDAISMFWVLGLPCFKKLSSEFGRLKIKFDDDAGSAKRTWGVREAVPKK